MTEINQELNRCANHNNYDINKIKRAHEIIHANGQKLGSIPMLSPINYYLIEGIVWCILSYTQIQYCGRYDTWREPEGFITCSRTEPLKNI